MHASATFIFFITFHFNYPINTFLQFPYPIELEGEQI
jgi:hypothetical protein